MDCMGATIGRPTRTMRLRTDPCHPLSDRVVRGSGATTVEAPAETLQYRDLDIKMCVSSSSHQANQREIANDEFS